VDGGALMHGWPGYVVLVLVILVAIAPGQVLGPVAALVVRHVGVGVVALVSLGLGAWTLGGAQSERAHWIGLAELALGAACAAWALYRLFVPAYRDQAPDSASLADDR
jgi:hypothetical protein